MISSTPPSVMVDGQSLDTTLARIAATVAARQGQNPETSYVARLLAKAPDAVLKKIGEEATELVMAAKDGQTHKIIAECADLWFHSLVLLQQYGLHPHDVYRELLRREGTSGLVEKAARGTHDVHSD